MSLSPQNGAFLQTGQYLAKARTTQGIIHILAPLFTRHHPVILQYVQMAGNRGHITPGILLKLTNAALTIQKHLHDHQTNGMPQGLENPGKRLQFPDG